MNNLGNVYKDQGQFQFAEKYYFDALDINLKFFGENHYKLASNIINIGDLYFK